MAAASVAVFCPLEDGFTPPTGKSQRQENFALCVADAFRARGVSAVLVAVVAASPQSASLSSSFRSCGGDVILRIRRDAAAGAETEERSYSAVREFLEQEQNRSIRVAVWAPAARGQPQQQQQLQPGGIDENLVIQACLAASTDDAVHVIRASSASWSCSSNSSSQEVEIGNMAKQRRACFLPCSGIEALRSCLGMLPVPSTTTSLSDGTGGDVPEIAAASSGRGRRRVRPPRNSSSGVFGLHVQDWRVLAHDNMGIRFAQVSRPTFEWIKEILHALSRLVRWSPSKLPVGKALKVSDVREGSARHKYLRVFVPSVDAQSDRSVLAKRMTCAAINGDDVFLSFVSGWLELLFAVFGVSWALWFLIRAESLRGRKHPNRQAENKAPAVTAWTLRAPRSSRKGESASSDAPAFVAVHTIQGPFGVWCASAVARAAENLLYRLPREYAGSGARVRITAV
eukprot:INCI3676.6.p1 GENE.INCI3676.6~~INCI3676.6.p1  ORF type:complete len:456 (-),score=71.09 INCI3676.6:1642-3009(-)